MQQQQKGLGERDGWNGMIALAVGHATAMTVFTRTNFGVEAFGKNAVAAFLVYWIWALATQSQALLMMGGLWFCMLIVQRIKTFVSWRRGKLKLIPSTYDGYPWLTARLFQNERNARGFEGCLVFVVGLVVFKFADWHVGYFLEVCGVSIVFMEMMYWHIERRRRLAIHDAKVEAKWLVGHSQTEL